MTRLTHILLGLFVTGGLLSSSWVHAQGVPDGDLVRHARVFPKVDSGVALTMHRSPQSNGWSIQISKKKKTLAVAELPEWAGASYYDVVSVADRIGQSWVVVLEARPNPDKKAPAGAESYQAAFAYGKSARTNRKIWKVIATATHSDLDGGERLVFRQNQRGRPDLIRLSTRDSTFCGGEAGYQIFVPGKLSFRSELNQDLLAEGAKPAAVSLPTQPFQKPMIGNYYLWYSATSDRRNSDDSSTVIRPLELGDLDTGTAWSEGDAGEGSGQFVTAKVNPGLKLKGFRIFPGHGGKDEFESYRRPKKILISLSDGTRFVANLPDAPERTLRDRGGLLVKLPEGVRTQCLSVVILESRPGSKQKLGEDAWKAQSTAISEITPISELYGLSRDDAAFVLVEMLLKQENSADARRLATLGSPLGEELVQVLRNVVDQGSESDRARIAPLLRYLPTKQSVPVLVRLFERVDPKDKSYLAVKRSLVTHREEASAQLIRMLYERPPKDARKHIDLVRLVGRLGGPDDIRPLIADLGKGESRLRDERIRAVTRGGEALLPDLFDVIKKTPDTPAAVDALRSIASLGRKLFYRTQGTAQGSEALISALESTKVKRVRLLGLRSLAYYETTGAVELLSDYAQHQNDPLVRKIAVESLARYSSDQARKILEGRLKDPSPDVRIEAAEGIGVRDDRDRSVKPLLDYVESERWPPGLGAGFEVLAQSGSSEALQELETIALSNPSSERAELATAAVERADRAFGTPAVETLINDPKTSFLMKRHAIDMLGSGPSEASELLLLDIIGTPMRFPSLDESRNETLRGRAIMALGRRRTTSARDTLLYILRDEKAAKTQKLVLRALAFFSDQSIIAELTIIKETAPEELEDAYDDAISMISRRKDVRDLGVTLDEVDTKIRERTPPSD